MPGKAKTSLKKSGKNETPIEQTTQIVSNFQGSEVRLTRLGSLETDNGQGGTTSPPILHSSRTITQIEHQDEAARQAGKGTKRTNTLAKKKGEGYAPPGFPTVTKGHRIEVQTFSWQPEEEWRSEPAMGGEFSSGNDKRVFTSNDDKWLKESGWVPQDKWNSNTFNEDYHHSEADFALKKRNWKRDPNRLYAYRILGGNDICGHCEAGFEATLDDNEIVMYTGAGSYGRSAAPAGSTSVISPSRKVIRQIPEDVLITSAREADWPAAYVQRGQEVREARLQQSSAASSSQSSSQSLSRSAREPQASPPPPKENPRSLAPGRNGARQRKSSSPQASPPPPEENRSSLAPAPNQSSSEEVSNGSGSRKRTRSSSNSPAPEPIGSPSLIEQNPPSLEPAPKRARKTRSTPPPFTMNLRSQSKKS